MPIYLYWGEDDFEIDRAVVQLQQQILNPDWQQFNYHKLPGDRKETILEGLNQVMTPVFGMGERLVWLAETNLCQQCSDDLLIELQRTLPVVPDTSHLLLTTSKKPDSRLKVTKLIKEYAQVKEFTLIPPWETDRLITKVKETAQTKAVPLTSKAIELLADSVGNNTRQLCNELDKLSLYYQDHHQPLDQKATAYAPASLSTPCLGEAEIASLVICNTQNSIKLAEAIIAGKTATALGLISDLINLNEPPLKIVATLVAKFRTWLVIKLMEETGNRDNKLIAEAAEIGNPFRVKYLQREIATLSSQQLITALPLLLDLEYSLKKGANSLATLQTKIIELCCLF
ncbi:DNA polymerase III, delta subunit [Stanieria cyanosphaera PCC 7437]|uniref:DNA polymerase III subunit delta n=1 Tax=Stanieria cyanosphaera (strain ATCC 29371 / PCC 7437) TaxID=111780 RepID=K9XV90_STAC7|nr:DNA polymerase III subunit delta [Stanieria cyanosphaera]AFZ35562.1 DNA polymerase III, delta subunit [Stanieria cyanosphaera PCC 7437]